MASEVEPMAKNPTGGCFARLHDVFTLTCSAYNKTDTDIPSSDASKNNGKAFSSFKTSSEVPAASDVGGCVRWPQASSASAYSEPKGSEPIQDGPPTPLRSLARPKNVHSETPYSANSLASLSLAVGRSSAYKEGFKPEDAEHTKFNSNSLFLAKPGIGPQSILKPDPCDGHEAFATGGKAVAIQQQNVYKHNTVLTNIPPPFSCVNSAFSLHSSRAIPQIVPMTVNAVSTNTKKPLQCEDPFHGIASREKFKIPACTTNQLSYSTSNGNRLEALNYIPILQTPSSITGFGGQQVINKESNLSLSNKKCQDFGRKRKSVSQTKPAVHTTCSAEEMNKGFLEPIDSAENDGHYHKRKQVKLVKPPNDNVENLKLVNGFAGLQGMDQVGKIGNFAESWSLKLNSNDAINPLGSFVPYSSRSNMQGYSHSEPGKISDTLVLDTAAAEVLIKQPRIGNIEEQNLDGQSRGLGLKPLTSSAYAPMPAAVTTFSSGGPTLPRNTIQHGSHGDSHIVKRESSQKAPSFELEWGKYLALSPTLDPSLLVDEGKTETILPYQKRFIQLQAFLKQCDEPDQDYLKALRISSAAARSKHAFELESRAIGLSLEEAKEINRIKMLDVFAKNRQTRLADEAGATTQGAQFPAIVSTKAHKPLSNC